MKKIVRLKRKEELIMVLTLKKRIVNQLLFSNRSKGQSMHLMRKMKKIAKNSLKMKA